MRDDMNFTDYQIKMLDEYYAQASRLQAENRKMKRVIFLLLVAGTFQWLLQWM